MKRIRMINAFSGTEMWVAENRVDEYKSAGNKLAAENIDVIPPVVEKKAEKKQTIRRKKKED